MNSFERRNKIVDLINTQGSVLVMGSFKYLWYF